MNTKDFLEIENSDKDKIHVTSNGAKLTLSLHDIPILGTFTRGDGKAGITHPCTPIFGPDSKKQFGLKQHGNMRNENVSLQHVADSIMVSHTITDESYRSGVSVKQIMGIEEGTFSFVMIHTNNGLADAPVNSGEHCYFDAPQGYKGTIVNGQDLTPLIEKNWDGVPIRLQKENTIQIPGKPEIVLTQNGFAYAMIWVGKHPDTKALDQTYVCIEPVEGDPTSESFGSTASVIRPGQSRSAMFSLSIR